MSEKNDTGAKAQGEGEGDGRVRGGVVCTKLLRKL